MAKFKLSDTGMLTAAFAAFGFMLSQAIKTATQNSFDTGRLVGKTECVTELLEAAVKNGGDDAKSDKDGEKQQ